MIKPLLIIPLCQHKNLPPVLSPLVYPETVRDGHASTFMPLELLGNGQLWPVPEKMTTLENSLVPATEKQLQRLLRLVSCYSCFIPPFVILGSTISSGRTSPTKSIAPNQKLFPQLPYAKIQISVGSSSSKPVPQTPVLGPLCTRGGVSGTSHNCS